MSDICRVALDAMGGDNAPGEVVKGAVEATKKENDIHVVLVGKEAAIQAELDKYDYSKELIEVVDAADVIETFSLLHCQVSALIYMKQPRLMVLTVGRDLSILHFLHQQTQSLQYSFLTLLRL